MGSSFRIGRIFGIDVKTHWMFLLLLIFFAFLGYRSAQSPTGALISVAVVLALFASKKGEAYDDLFAHEGAAGYR